MTFKYFDALSAVFKFSLKISIERNCWLWCQHLAFQGSKILMIGAGGIGCELLKTLVMTGFNNIELVQYSCALTCMSVANTITDIYLSPQRNDACNNVHTLDRKCKNKNMISWTCLQSIQLWAHLLWVCWQARTQKLLLQSSCTWVAPSYCRRLTWIR